MTVRYFAAAKAAVGHAEQSLTLAHPSSVADVLHAAVASNGPALEQVLMRCSFLLGATAVHGPGTPVTDGDVLDILPPFAGG